MNADPMRPTLYEVSERIQETDDVFSLTLEGPPFTYVPGQFNMVYAFGCGEAPISVSGPSRQSRGIVHTIRAVGTVTQALARLTPGDPIGIRGPFGTPWPLDQAEGKDVLVIAGGIGLAPLRPVIYEVLSQWERFGRLLVLYGTRSRENILYDQELLRWGDESRARVDVILDRGDAHWNGQTGVVTALIERAEFDVDHCHAMVCGPEVMMRFSARELLQRGVAPEAITLSMERNMHCAVGHCGHCQFGHRLVCRDGAVFPYVEVRDHLTIREL